MTPAETIPDPLQVRRLTWYLSLLLVFLTATVFASVAHNQFIVLDDHLYVTQNAMVQRGLSVEGWVWAWTTFDVANYHPLTWLSHMLDWQLYGNKAWGHHLTSAAFHVANTLLLFLVLRRLTSQTWRCYVVAALFGLHPLHVESVAWVAERKDVLSTFFGFLALGGYASYCVHPGWRRYLLVVALFALSLLCKPMWVTFPCLLLLLDYWPLGRLTARAAPAARPSGRRLPGLILEKGPLLLLSAVSAVVTILAQGQAMQSLTRLSLSERISNSLVSYVRYLGLLLWPVDLTVLYPLKESGWSLVAVLGAALLLLLVTGVAVALRSRQPALFVGWLWYLGTLVPVIGLVQVGPQALADRYTYVPLIGIFLALVWALCDSWIALRIDRKVLEACAVVVLLTCSVLSWLQIQHWRDEETLWRHTLAVANDNPMAVINVAQILKDQGKMEEAFLLYQRAVRLVPKDPVLQNILGSFFFDKGKLEEALLCFTQAVTLDSTKAHYQSNRGLALASSRHEEAAGCFRAALRLAPDKAEYLYYLANTLEQRGDSLSAQAYDQATKLAPDFPRQAHETAQLFLSDETQRLTRPRHLLFLAQVASGATRHRQPEIIATLADAWYVNGQPARAMATARQAAAAARAAGKHDMAQQIEEHCRQYQTSGSPKVSP